MVKSTPPAMLHNRIPINKQMTATNMATGDASLTLSAA